MESLGAQVPADLKQRMTEIGKEHDRKLSAEVRVALREYVDRHDASEAERSAAA